MTPAYIPDANHLRSLIDMLLGRIDALGGGGGTPWDFDEGSASTTYGTGTIDFDEGAA